MPDFHALVRTHVAPLALPAAQELKIVEELAAQLEESYDQLLASGLSDVQAWEELQQQLPPWSAIRDGLRSEPVLLRSDAVRQWRASWRDRLTAGAAGDVRSAFRLLVRAPGFAVGTTVILALCLGANLAIGSVVYAVLLRSLPMPHPDRVVVIGDVYPTLTPDDIFSSTSPTYLDRRQAVTALESQALMARWSDTVTIDGAAAEIRGMRATPSLFAVTQVQPALGRAFTDADAVPGADRKLILSDALWRRLFDGNPDVIGRTLRMGWTGELYTIVGVMPRDFWFFDPGLEFWMPLTLTAAHAGDDVRTSYRYVHVGRLAEAASVEHVRSQIDALNARMAKRFPQFQFTELGMYTAVTPLHAALTRGVRPMLYVLSGGALLLLIIGTINIAALTMTRVAGRTRELATRLALGAGRVRLLRQLLVEGLLSAALGGVAGVILGAWSLAWLVTVGADRIPNGASIRVDSTLLIATAVAALLIGLLIAAVSTSVLLARGNTHTLVSLGARASGGRQIQFVRRALVIVQVAASVALLIGAALLLTSLRNLRAVDPGFIAERVVTARIFPPPSRYPDAGAVARLSERILEGVRQLPGVRAAGFTSNIALSGQGSPAAVGPPGPPPPGQAIVLPTVVTVSSGYFEAMGTRIVRGRVFDARDTSEAPAVAIVDERLAARFWPSEDAIGKTIFRGNAGPFTVVGIVAPVRYASLTGSSEPVGAAYFPHTQLLIGYRLRFLAVKTALASTDIVRDIRAVISAIDPDLPLVEPRTMEERTARSVLPQRLAATLTGMFGVAALTLSLLGLYAVLATAVAQRTREIGIRIALGSTVRQVFQLVFREGLMLVTIGLALGALSALALGRTLQGLIYGVTPSNPTVILTVLLTAGLVALFACASPAYRAARIEPVRALRNE